MTNHHLDPATPKDDAEITALIHADPADAPQLAEDLADRLNRDLDRAIPTSQDVSGDAS